MQRATPSSPSPVAERIDRVRGSPEAVAAVQRLQKERGSILFVQSGGCCDGSMPMCFPVDEFIIGDLDLELGSVAGAPVYIDRRQFDVWKDSQILLDVADGDPEGFSLGAGPGRHFVTRSHICAPGTLRPPTAPRPSAMSGP